MLEAFIDPFIFLVIVIAIAPILAMVELADKWTDGETEGEVDVRTIHKVIGLTLVPAIGIMVMTSSWTNPVVTGFLGALTGYVLGQITYFD